MDILRKIFHSNEGTGWNLWIILDYLFTSRRKFVHALSYNIWF